MIKKIILFIFGMFLCSLVLANSERIYHVVVPFSAGGASDVTWRHIEREMNQRLKFYDIKLITKNVTGAGGSIGLKEVISNDKLTFGFFSPFFAINKNLRTNFSYDYDSVNFIGFAGFNKMIIISGKHKSIEEMMHYCKNNHISFGSSGLGSTSHLVSYYFSKKYLKCKTILDIPYRGVSQVYPDLKSGTVDFMADFMIAVDNFISTGYFYDIKEINENDISSWHVFVSNKIETEDLKIISLVFNDLKIDSIFVNSLEKKFQIFKFADTKDSIWLRNEFEKYKELIGILLQKQ